MGLLSSRSSKSPVLPVDDDFRQMMDSMPQLVWMTDNEGRSIWYNKRWYEYTGLTLQDVQTEEGRRNLIHPDHADRVLTHLHNKFKNGGAWEDCFPIRAKDGAYNWFLSRAQPIMDADGNIVRWFGTHTDISQQRALEQSLREAIKHSEVASNAKSEFLANMSHEIRTPMNVVIGLSNILARSNPLTPKQRQFIGTLQTSANALLALINDLLDFAKIEAQTLEFERIPFNLATLLREIGDGMEIRAREKDLDFRVDIDEQDIDVVGDPTRLRQIITNLCGNAVKFTQAGYVAISCTRKMSADKRMSDIEIRVADTGMGIPADKIDKVFQKFTQADPSINRKFGGTGLGLPISLALAEAMGGRIEVTSVEGRGSVFTMRLTLQNAMQARSVPTELRHDPKTRFERGNRILLVEDHAPNILVARTVIEEFGLECDTALNGREALEKLSMRQYLAVIMDVQMPELDGLETTRRWRAMERERGQARMPIIGMTAYARTEDREKCLECGMDEYIAKPFGIAELHAKLESCVENLPQLKAA